MEPTTERGRRTRDRIVSVAADLIRERGPDAASIDAVIDSAAVSKGQLYHYFAGKEALIDAAVDLEVRVAVGAAVDRFALITSPLELHQFLDDFFADHDEQNCAIGCSIGTLSAELAGRNASATQLLGAAFESWESAIRLMLDRFVESGFLKPQTDTTVVASATLALIEGGLLLAKTTGDGAKLRASLETIKTNIGSHSAEAIS